MRPRGFTLIELMIGLAIFAILLFLAAPTMVQFMGNTRIRNIADSIAQGAKQAQVEAIKRNRDVEFTIDPATGWQIRDPDVALGGVVHTEPFTTGATVTVNPVPPGTLTVVYSALGQYRADGTPGAPPAPGPMQRIRVTSDTISNPHPLEVVVDPALGVGVRVCDPQFSSVAVDPTKSSIGCPP
jgi:type IV fimbrial biogenesis protein FimT